MKRTKQEKAITLIALIITIIILLILSIVTINAIQGDDGLITKANNAAKKYKDAAAEENSLVQSYLAKIPDETNITDEEGTFAGKYYKAPGEEFYIKINADLTGRSYECENNVYSCLYEGTFEEKISKSDTRFTSKCSELGITSEQINQLDEYVVIAENFASDSSNYYFYIFKDNYSKANGFETNINSYENPFTGEWATEVVDQNVINALNNV